jgi:hypothetical protein
MSLSKGEFRGNNICGTQTSFTSSECFLPVRFELLARLGEIWYKKYTNTAV